MRFITGVLLVVALILYAFGVYFIQDYSAFGGFLHGCSIATAFFSGMILMIGDSSGDHRS